MRQQPREIPLRPEFEHRLKEAHSKVLEAEQEYATIHRDIENILLSEIVLKYNITDNPLSLELVIGSCTVAEACVYNTDEDPCRDICILCHSPYERK